jgi:sugar phosphate isomerase/epimerase
MNRRRFLQVSSAAAVLAATHRSLAAAGSAKPSIGLGMDNFAVRAMGWKAPALIDHAAALKLDALLISDLDAYDSLEDAALREVRRHAEAAGVALYAGSWSICPTSKAFKKNWGTAEDHLRLGIRVAKALGSPVFRVVLGTLDDRKTEGGIRARIADTVAVLKACRADAARAGIKVAIENHAGDMHSWELVDLIKAAGPEWVGANIDSGNAAWTLEDPMDVLENLGPYTICSSLRDEQDLGHARGRSRAMDRCRRRRDRLEKVRRALGRAVSADPHHDRDHLRLAARVPVQTAGILAALRSPARGARPFRGVGEKGHALQPFKAPPGPEGKIATQEFQKAELAKSISYLRNTIGLGLKA